MLDIIRRITDHHERISQLETAESNSLEVTNPLILHNGAGVPGAGLGSNDDYYLDTASTNSDLYYKSGGAWAKVDEIRGATGATGSTGATGADGVNPVWLVGSGVPAGATGSDNDMYMDTASGDVYGPKSGGAWGAAVMTISGTSAPTVAEYLALATNANLVNERVFTPGDGLSATDAGAGGTYTLDVDAFLTSIAALGTAADKMIYTTGVDTAAEAALTAWGRSLLDDANQAAARTTLGLTPGTDVQAWDTQLDDIAALAVTDGNFIVGDGANWVAESGATARASLGLTTVGAIYNTNAGQSISDSTLTIIDFEDVVTDTHSAVTTGASWHFTVPTGEGGLYLVGSLITYDSLDPQDNEFYSVKIRVDSVNFGSLENQQGLTSGGSSDWSFGGSRLVLVAAGDEIWVEVYQESGAAETLKASVNLNWVYIAKIGMV